MDKDKLPQHIAIIMDGNGRWAKKRCLPRVAGHKAGVNVAKKVVKFCLERGIKILTIFAFSSENWKRPQEEVSYLMGLFRNMLERESDKLHEQNVKLSVMGDRTNFDDKVCNQITAVELLTQNNTGLHLVVAFNYGGRWDIAQSVSKILTSTSLKKRIDWDVNKVLEKIQQNLYISDLPSPDLFIRTSGERRISNFFLWQLAYTELYFTDIFWPDFDEKEFDKALSFYSTRERRYGELKDECEA